jgi:hypothetical protein
LTSTIRLRHSPSSDDTFLKNLYSWMKKSRTPWKRKIRGQRKLNEEIKNALKTKDKRTKKAEWRNQERPENER